MRDGEPRELEFADEATLSTFFRSMKVLLSDSNHLIPYLTQGVIAYVEQFNKRGRSRYFGKSLRTASWCILMASIGMSLFKIVAFWISL
jgi:hypothetical protein